MCVYVFVFVCVCVCVCVMVEGGVYNTGVVSVMESLEVHTHPFSHTHHLGTLFPRYMLHINVKSPRFSFARFQTRLSLLLSLF